MTDRVDAATDVYSIAGTSAWDLLWSEDRRATLPRLRARSVGPVQLTRLGELLGLGGFEEVLRGFSLLAGESQESPWVISIPGTLIEAVASLAPGEIDDVASRWAEAGDVPSALASTALLAYLEALQDLFATAVGPFVIFVRTE